MDAVLICLIVALILFILAAVPVPKSPVHLGWAGAAFLVLAFVFERV